MIMLLQRRFEDLALAVAVLGAGAGVLALVAFTRPAAGRAHTETPYTQSGDFAYTAAVSAPQLYDDGAVGSGDPVFSRLSDRVDFSYTYRLETAAAHTFNGAGTFTAELREASGWKRSLPLANRAAFNGDQQVLAGTLKLSDLNAIMETYKEQTGIARPQFSLTLRTTTKGDGVIGDTPFTVAFAPSVDFLIDEFALRLAPRDVREGSPLSPSGQQFAGGSRPAANRLTLLGVGLNISAARVLALAGLFLAAIGGAALFFLSRRRERSAGIDEAMARYGRIIVRGRDLPVEKARPLAVQSLDDLVRVAQAEQTVVMAVEHRGVTSYIVRTVAGAYSYVSTGEALHQVAA